MKDYILEEPFMGVSEGYIVLESENYKFETPNGILNLTQEFLDNSNEFNLISKEKTEVNVEEYVPDSDQLNRYKMELIIKCTEEERDKIRTFLEKNIEKIKKGLV